MVVTASENMVFMSGMPTEAVTSTHVSVFTLANDVHVDKTYRTEAERRVFFLCAFEFDFAFDVIGVFPVRKTRPLLQRLRLLPPGIGCSNMETCTGITE